MFGEKYDNNKFGFFKKEKKPEKKPLFDFGVNEEAIAKREQKKKKIRDFVTIFSDD